LKQASLGTPIAELCRQHGVSEQSYYRWKKIYGGMEPSEARELKQLREENVKLKRLVADLSLDKVMLQDVSKKILKPVKKREMVNYLMGRYGWATDRRAAAFGCTRSMYLLPQSDGSR
jgi:putative transposase